MIILGILLSILLGMSVLLAISTHFKPLEYLFLAFPIGIGTQTFLMSLLDWVNIGIFLGSTVVASFLAIGVLGFFAHRNIRKNPEFMNQFMLKNWRLPKPNLSWIILVTILIWFEGINFYKTVYFPTFDTDSIRGFDFIGRTVAIEGSLKSLSLFNDPNLNFQGNAGLSSYTPFAQLAYSYAYIFGAEASKIINALMYLSFLGMFYALLKRVTTHTAAAFFTLFMLVTPEMVAFSALSGINVLHAVFASTGLLYAVLWYKNKEHHLLILSGLLLALNCFTRNEGIVFSLVASAIVASQIFFKNIDWKKALLFVLFAFSGFIYWTLFLKANNIHSGNNLIILKPFWDADKFHTIINELNNLYFNKLYYGLSIVAFCAFFVLNLWNIVKRKDQWVLLTAIFGVIFVYTLLIYQIDYVWDSIENVLRFSYKRFLFSFIPLFWFYIATNHLVLWVTQKADGLLYKEKIY